MADGEGSGSGAGNFVWAIALRSTSISRRRRDRRFLSACTHKGAPIEVVIEASFDLLGSRQPLLKLQVTL